VEYIGIQLVSFLFYRLHRITNMLRLLLAGILFVLSASSANAAVSSFLIGFMHPVLGFDHLLAMLAVGLLSVQIGGRAIWTVPAAFVLFLAAGGLMGMTGIALPEVEAVIALSVLLLGLAIAAETRMPIVIAMVFVGFFAVFHGHAHGAEVPSMAEPWKYVFGFVAASAALHLTGVATGIILKSNQLRAKLGSAVAGIGLYMVLLTYAMV
jgi:urease accessory protein